MRNSNLAADTRQAQVAKQEVIPIGYIELLDADPYTGVGELTAIRGLARSFLEPLLRAGSPMRTARPTTGAAFARLKFLDRALDPAAAC